MDKIKTGYMAGEVILLEVFVELVHAIEVAGAELTDRVAGPLGLAAAPGLVADAAVPVPHVSPQRPRRKRLLLREEHLPVRYTQRAATFHQLPINPIQTIKSQ